MGLRSFFASFASKPEKKEDEEVVLQSNANAKDIELTSNISPKQRNLDASGRPTLKPTREAAGNGMKQAETVALEPVLDGQVVYQRLPFPREIPSGTVVQIPDKHILALIQNKKLIGYIKGKGTPHLTTDDTPHDISEVTISNEYFFRSLVVPRSKKIPCEVLLYNGDFQELVEIKSVIVGGTTYYIKNASFHIQGSNYVIGISKNKPITSPYLTSQANQVLVTTQTVKSVAEKAAKEYIANLISTRAGVIEGGYLDLYQFHDDKDRWQSKWWRYACAVTQAISEMCGVTSTIYSTKTNQDFCEANTFKPK